MKRTPLRRKTPLRQGSSLARSAPIARSRPLPKVNRQRKASAFARCYHSQARVRFVKRLPCVACGYEGPVPRANAHTINDGAGRKGHYTTIIPLCEVPAPMACHTRQHGINGGWLAIGMTAESCRRFAAATEAAWQARPLARVGESPDCSTGNIAHPTEDAA